MKKKKSRKSNAQLIVATLMTGKTLKSRDISDMVFENSGRVIKVQDVASMLSKISDGKRCDLGFFIKRKQRANGFVYHVVKEALGLTELQAYELTLKSGKNRYTLDQAMEEFPKLAKHVKGRSKPRKLKAEPKPVSKKPAPKKAVKPAKVPKPVKKEVAPAKVMEPMPETVSSDEDLEKLAAQLMRKMDELGGLNINVNLSFNVEGPED